MSFNWEDLLFRLPVPIRRVPIGPDTLPESGDTPLNLKPIPVGGAKVTPKLRTRIRERRHLDEPFSINYDQKLAVIIPYRDRQEHLDELLPRLTSELTRQSIDFRIIVVEQEAGSAFNPGVIKNIGAKLTSDWADYYCFHDVDQLPKAAIYGCPSQPFRPIGKWSSTWRDMETERPGGLSPVALIRKDQFLAINGYDNHYLRIGWGYEDIDLLTRCLLAGLVPHADENGVFDDSANPSQEDAWRAKKRQRRAKKRYKWLMLLDKIGASGLSEIEDFEVLESETDQNISRHLVRIRSQNDENNQHLRAE